MVRIRSVLFLLDLLLLVVQRVVCVCLASGLVFFLRCDFRNLVSSVSLLDSCVVPTAVVLSTACDFFVVRSSIVRVRSYSLRERPLPKKSQANVLHVEKSINKNVGSRGCHRCREKGHLASSRTNGTLSNPIITDDVYSLAKRDSQMDVCRPILVLYTSI